MDNVAEEIQLSYSLLFTRNQQAKDAAKKLFQGKADIIFVKNEKLEAANRGASNQCLDGANTPNSIRIVEWDEGRAPTLAHFIYLRVRLATLREQMLEWKPEGFKDILTPGYADRFTFYTTLFGLFVGLLGGMGIALSFIQTYHSVGARPVIEVGAVSCGIFVLCVTIYVSRKYLK